MQAIILAGGFGTRLQNVVKDIPKPMAPINAKPFLFYLLSYLKKHNFTDIIFSVHYLKEQIEQYFGNNFLGLNISYAIEEEPLGTGGAIINSFKYIDKSKPVVILNGDTFLEIDYQKLIVNHQKNKVNFTIALKEMNNCSRYGKVEINQNDVIIDFKEKSNNQEQGFINSGIYVVNPNIFDKYKNKLTKKFSFETDFLMKFTKELEINAFKVKDYFIDIGIPEDYQKAQNEIPKRIKNKALFLDRDGVINIDHGYVGKIEDFDFIDGIFELCQKAQDKGYLIIIVTNQAGIARGYYTEEQFLELTKWMENEFKKKEIHITKTYYCPYHIDAKITQYKKDSEDRKPKPGMLLKAIDKFNIDPKKSIMIGDKKSDIEAGRGAGIRKRIRAEYDNIKNHLVIVRS